MDKAYLNFELKALDDDPNYHVFEGYASVFNNKDYGADVMLPGAFQKSLQSEHKVKILWQHKKEEVIGMPTELREDEKGLYIKGLLPKDDSLVKDRVFPQMKMGSLEMSIGFRINEREFKDNVRYIKEVDLFEISLVSIGMNNKAQITAFKHIDIDSIKDMTEKEQEQAFKAGFIASNKTAKLLVSAIKTIETQRDAVESKQRDVVLDQMKDITFNKVSDTMQKLKLKYKK